MNIFQLIGDNLFYILFVGFVITILFLIGREIVTWYFKLNRVVELLEKIEENTRHNSTVEYRNEVSASQLKSDDKSDS